MSATCSEQDPGARRHHLSAGVEIGLRDRAEQPSQSASVVEHPDSADPWQGHRAGMSHSDADAEGAILPLFVAETEAVAAAPLALAPRKPDPDWPVAGAGLCVGSEGPAEVNCGLLEHLRSNITTPWQARDLLGDGPVWGGDEDAPSGFAALPTIEGVDQVIPRPGHGRGRVGGVGTVRRTNELKALVVGEPRRPSAPEKHRNPR